MPSVVDSFEAFLRAILSLFIAVNFDYFIFKFCVVACHLLVIRGVCVSTLVSRPMPDLVLVFLGVFSMFLTVPFCDFPIYVYRQIGAFEICKMCQMCHFRVLMKFP